MSAAQPLFGRDGFLGLAIDNPVRFLAILAP